MAVRAHKATPAKKKVVEKMASFGVPYKEIADTIDCAPSALRRHYATELATAKAKANTKVADSLFINATKNMNVTAQTFWLKTRAGWKEPKQEMKLSGAVGNYDLNKLSTEKLRDLERILAAAEPDGNSGNTPEA